MRGYEGGLWLKHQLLQHFAKMLSMTTEYERLTSAIMHTSPGARLPSGVELKALHV